MTFTPEQQDEAKWYVNKAITIQQHARAVERKRHLTDADILDRVPPEERDRFLKAKALHASGAYRPE